MLSRCLIVFVTWVIVQVYSAKILVVAPAPSISHQLVFRPLIQELVSRGHEVTVLTTDPAFPQGTSPKNLIEIDLHDLSYKLWQKVYNVVTKTDYISVMEITFGTLHEIIQEQLRDKSVKKLIKDKTINFDLLVLEECAKPSLIFSRTFDAPVVLISSFGDCRNNMNVIGALTHPLLYPTQFHQRIYNLTIWEKISQLHDHIAFNRVLEQLDVHADRNLQSMFGIDTPTLKEMQNNVHALFLNIHPIWIHNQPAPSNFIYMWGLHRTPIKTLPKDLQVYLDSSKIGVIYVSFGTNFKTSSMRPETLEIFLKVFSRLPYNILWKWDMDELPGKSDNIRIYKWFPQNDVLRHPKVKLFITQGGLQSTDEAINAGVPVIGFPVFGDQDYNTENYVHFRIGDKLQFSSLTVELLENSIHTILTDYDKYRKNIIHLRSRLHDSPKPALQKAIWWLEYILRHGGIRHLRAPAANMSWTDYYEVDLVLTLLSGLISLGAIVLLTLYYCLKYVSYNSTRFLRTSLSVETGQKNKKLSSNNKLVT